MCRLPLLIPHQDGKRADYFYSFQTVLIKVLKTSSQQHQYEYTRVTVHVICYYHFRSIWTFVGSTVDIIIIISDPFKPLWAQRWIQLLYYYFINKSIATSIHRQINQLIVHLQYLSLSSGKLKSLKNYHLYYCLTSQYLTQLLGDHYYYSTIWISSSTMGAIIIILLTNKSLWSSGDWYIHRGIFIDNIYR